MTDWWDEQASSLAGARHAVWGEEGPDIDWDTRAEECLGLIVPHLRVPQGGRVIEIGCGVGRLIIPFAMRRPDASFIGVDTSPRMLAHAGQESGGIDNVDWRLGAGDVLPVFGNVDAVYSMVTFQHLPPPVVHNYLGEAKRVLRPRGVFRFQFVRGDEHLGLNHLYTREQMVGMCEGVGLDVLTVEPGVMFPQWTWITAARP